MKKLLFIVNPRAGDGRHLHELAQAVALSAEAECVITAFDGPAPERDRLRAHAAAIVFGGDGTLNAWLEPLARDAVPTVIYPAGTVNNLAHELGVPADFRALGMLLRAGPATPLPLVTVNGRPFASYGTLGVGAENSRYMHATRASMQTLRRLFPMLQTPIFACRTILLSDAYLKRVRLRIAGTSREIVTPGIYVTTQAKLNKYIELGWNPSAHPGHFLVLVLKDRGRRALLRTCMRLYTERSVRAVADDVEIYRTSELSIEALDGDSLSFYGDGEPLVNAPALELRIAREPLWVFDGRRHEAAGSDVVSSSNSVQV